MISFLKCLPAALICASPLSLVCAQVVINEIHYDHEPKTERGEFVELVNVGSGAVDLSGWTLSGAVSYEFPDSTTIAAGGFLVVAEDRDFLLARFGAAAAGNYAGRLSNSGERLRLEDPSGATADEVDYGVGFPWPTAARGVGASMELVNPGLDNDLGGSWRSSLSGTSGDPTPGSVNSVFSEGAPPNVRQVDHFPEQPVRGQDVVVTAKITDPDGVGAVVLRYQLVDPGSYIRKSDAEYETAWTDLPMLPQGPGDPVYSALLPGDLQVHRRLVRYRITVEDTLGNAVQVPYSDDESPNFAYFCYDGIPDWTGAKRAGREPDHYASDALDNVAVYHLIAQADDVEECQYRARTGADGEYLHYPGTWVYDGEVYDHIRYRIRGSASTLVVGKNKWKINFNRARPFEARDNYGEKYEIAWDKINVLPGTNPWWRNDASTDGTLYCESLGFRLYELVGAPSSRTQFFHYRVIDATEEATADQYEGDFWGLYIAIEQPDSRFLEARGLPSGNLYNAHGTVGGSSLVKRNQGPTQVEDSSDLSMFQRLHRSSTPLEDWQANLDLPSYFGWNIGNLAINNADARPQENVNYYHNPETGRWEIIPWDLDLTFEDAPHLGRGDTEAWESIYHCLRYPEISIPYENRVREVLDLLLDNDQSAHLVDEYAGFLDGGGEGSIVEANQALWDFHPKKRKRGIWYRNFNPTLLPEQTFAALTQYTKDFITTGGYGRENLAEKQVDPAVPDRPTITYSGVPGFPTDGLQFTSSAFADPQGDASFGSMEWRIGEVRNPSTPGYVAGDRYIYEIETFSSTGPLTSFQENFTAAAVATRPGKTYRARVRHTDSTGRASHWSAPVEFTATPPDVSVWQSSLVVSELLYKPAGDSGAEFLELTNIGTTTLDLTNVRFTKGVDFDFAGSAVTQLGPGAQVLVVEDIALFETVYGTGLPVAGEYKNNSANNLSGGGELVRLSLGAGTTIREFTYDDAAPWPTSPDTGGFSLVLLSPETNPDHGLPQNWRASSEPGGNPGSKDTAPFPGTPDADDDHDGFPALIEFLSGTSDVSPTSIPQFLPGIVGDRPTLTFVRDPAAGGLQVELQSSSDLVTWNSHAYVESWISTRELPEGKMEVTLGADAVSGNFLRLRVSR